MRVNFSIVLIAGALGFLGCGSQEIEVTPGPQLTEMLNSRESVRKMLTNSEQAEAKVKAQADFLSEISRCGLDHIPTKNEIQNPSQKIEIRFEGIRRDNGQQVQAISLQTSILSIRGIKKLLETDPNSPLAGSSWKSDTLKLTPNYSTPPQSLLPAQKIPLPIIFRTKCVFIDEGESLETEGREIFIITDQIVQNGRIRTSPSAHDDQPGESAGAVYISTIVGEFGPNAVVDISGGNAGPIKMKPGIVLDSSYGLQRLRFTQMVKADVIDPVLRERKVGDKRMPRPDEAWMLFEIWEHGRAGAGIVGVSKFEREIYNPEKWGSESLKNEMTQVQMILSNERATPNDRAQIIHDHSGIIRGSWASLITEAQKNYERNMKDPRQTKFYYLLPEKLSVAIDDFEYSLLPKPHFYGRPFYEVRKQAFRELMGGSPGHLDLRGLWLNRKPAILESSGLASDMSKIPSAPEYSLPPGEVLRIPVETYESHTIVYHLEKDYEDKVAVSIPYTTEKVINQTKSNSIEVEIRESLGAVISVDHPNRRLSPLPQKLNSEISTDSAKAFDAFTNWGIAAGESRIHEAAKFR